MSADRQDFINGLRQLADYLEARPALPVPDDLPVQGWVFSWDDDAREELAAAARAMGKAEKQVSDFAFTLRGPQFAGGIYYYVGASRHTVCERVVVGTEKVEVPDPNAPTITEEREIVEWHCPDSLLDAA